MISVIVTTRNRMKEVDKFLVHLEAQTYRDFELLLVDQNSGQSVPELLKRHSFRKRYFHSEERGASRGRNISLRAAQGDIIAIPDDDCWYSPDLLETIVQWFDAHPDIDMLCVLECNPDGAAMVPQNPPAAGFCTDQPVGLFPERSVWIAQSSMVFLRRKVLDTVGLLNEGLGVGCDTKYQSGEETDFFLRAMHAGFRMWFEPSIKVFHVELRTPERLRKTNYSYSVGTGRTLRLHGCRVSRLLAVELRALGGALTSLVRLDLPLTMVYLRRCLGILEGYFG
jgi:glycosyltransferase involved in cell wall biosynthesis